MIQSLTIGLVSHRPGWKLLLRQIGLRFEDVTWKPIAPESFAAIILDGIVSAERLNEIENYLESGGAVLDLGSFAASREPQSLRSRRIGTLVEEFDDPYRAVGVLDIDARVRVHSRSNALARTILLEDRGKGAYAYLPFPVARLVVDTSWKRKRFVTPDGPFPDEVVARRTKGELRRIVEGTLRWLMARRGLPFVHAWRFPEDHRSIFAFRVDSDSGSEREMIELYEVARRHAITTSWYLHVEAHVDHLDTIRRFHIENGDELAVHCYRHKAHRTKEAIGANISEAIGVLRSEGIEPTGYAAPNGRWRRELDRALDEFGLPYSSEFTLDYDDLPFHPWTGGEFSRHLQVPIHPVSIGNFMRARSTPHQMIAYYKWIIDRCMATSEPAILYHHPTHHRLDVIDAIFAHANDLELPNMTMGEYAEWWEQRLAARFVATADGDRITIDSDAISSRVRLRVVAPDGSHAYIDRSGEIDRSSLDWHAPQPAPPPMPLRHEVRRWSIRLLQHAIEDFNSLMRQ